MDAKSTKPAVDLNGSSAAGGTREDSSVVLAAEVLSVETAIIFDTAARRVMVLRAKTSIELGSILVDVQHFCKSNGVKFSAFLSRADVQISQDAAERSIRIWKEYHDTPVEALAGVDWTKLYALLSIGDAQVRLAILSDPTMKSTIQEASTEQVKLATVKLSENVGKLEGNVESLREQLKATTKKAGEELKVHKQAERDALIRKDGEIDRLKKELAAVQKMSPTDVDAVKIYREQNEGLKAELETLAGQFKTMTVENGRLKAAQENLVTDKRLREQLREANEEVKDREKKLKELGAKVEELTKAQTAKLEVEGVDLPQDFPGCTLSDALTFIAERELLGDFTEWLGVPVNGRKVAA